MPVQLNVAGQEFLYPIPGDSPDWSEGATDWAEAVTTTLSEVIGPGDILQTPATINNTGVLTNVSGLFFDPTVVRGAIVEYSVYRVTTGAGATELVEAGTMYLTYKSTAAVWDLVVVGSSGANITFSIISGGANSGQVQYVATPITGSSYVGTMKFRARSLTQ